MEGGRLVGLDDAGIAPILNNGGEPLSGKRWGDAEGLRIIERDGVPVALVSFEGANDLRAFSGAEFVASHSVDVPLPASTRDVDRNAGFEGLAVAPASSPLQGGIVLLAEHSLDASGNHRGWIVGGPRAGTFSLQRLDTYDVTDAAFLPDGDLLVLERQLGFPLGVGMRVRRIAADDLRPGATVDGEVLLEADLRYQIDNMEGIAVGRGPERRDDHRARLRQQPEQAAADAAPLLRARRGTRLDRPTRRSTGGMKPASALTYRSRSGKAAAIR